MGINADLKLFMSKLREIIVLVWKVLPCFETMFSQVSYLEFSLGTECLLKILETDYYLRTNFFAYGSDQLGLILLVQLTGSTGPQMY